MRPLFAYMQAMAVPTGVFASPYDWGSEGTNALVERIDRAVAELVSLLKGSRHGSRTVGRHRPVQRHVPVDLQPAHRLTDLDWVGTCHVR